MLVSAHCWFRLIGNLADAPPLTGSSLHGNVQLPPGDVG
jgi:hypothetical protein